MARKAKKTDTAVQEPEEALENDSIETEAADDGDDDDSYSASSNDYDSDSDDDSSSGGGSSDDHLVDYSVKSRETARAALNSQIEEFLSRGGKINLIENNVTADPPRKPTSNYGSRPI